MPGSKELIEQFEAKYGIPGAFEAVEKRADQFKYLDDFLFERQGDANKKYVSGIVNMLNIYAESKIKPTATGTGYSMKEMNTIQFMRDYDEIMQTKHEETNPSVERKPYNGIGSRVMDAAAACMETYSKSLVDLWVERIKVGAFSLDNMRGHTDMLHNEFLNKSSLENTVDRRAAETAVLIHAAMAKVAAERGWGWKLNPFNWVRWYQESRYMSQLAAQQPTYDRLGMSLDSVTGQPEYAQPMTNEPEIIRAHKAARIAERQAQNAEKAAETENIKEALHLDPNTLEQKPVVEENVQEPVVEEPVVEEPVVQAPVVQAPVVEEPVQKSVVEEPVVEEPVVEDPVVEEPVVEEPVVQAPVVQEPVVQEPMVQEPVVQEPMVQEPVVQEQSTKEEIENLMGEILNQVEEQMTAEEPVVEEPVVQEPVVQETVVQETVVQEQSKKEEIENPMGETLNQVEEQMTTEEPAVQEPEVREPKPEGITVETVSENVEEIAMDFLDGMMNDIDASLNIKSEAQTIEELTDDPRDDIPNWVEDEELPFMERYEKRLANKELADRTRNQVTAIIRRAGVTNKNILDDVVGETFDIRRELTIVYRGLELSEIESNMGDIATYVHGRAYEYLKNSGLDAKERFITAQHVANLMMRFYSPVAFGDEGMEKYAENYVVSNTDILKARLGVHVFPDAAFDPSKGYEIKMKIDALASEITDEFVRIGAIDAPVVEEPVEEELVEEELVDEESEAEELEVEEPEVEELEVEESKGEAIKTEAPRKTDAVGKPLNMNDAWKLRNNRTLTQAIQNQMSEFMDKYKTPNTNFVAFGLHKDVDRFWLAFSDAKNEKDESKMQRSMKEYSINIFESVYASTQDMAGENLSTADKIIAVQKITNLWLNTYSPVASDSSYAEYGDNYFVKHVDPKTLREDPLFYGESVESLEKALQEAKFELGIVDKLQVNLSAEFSEKPVERSAKVAETQAPTKTQVRE